MNEELKDKHGKRGVTQLFILIYSEATLCAAKAVTTNKALKPTSIKP